MPKEFIPVNLPAPAVEKLRKLKIACSFSSGKIPSYGEVIDMLFDSLEKSNPGLYSTYLHVKDTSVDNL